MNKIIFHIGYPRTGSTYLQEKVFPKINNINFIGKPFKSIDSKIFYNFDGNLIDDRFELSKKVINLIK